MGETLPILVKALDDRSADALGGWKCGIILRWWRRNLPTIILAIPCLSVRSALSRTISRWGRVRCDAQGCLATVFAHHEELQGGEIPQYD